MGDRFHQISMEALTDWVFDELEQEDQLFGIPRSAFFVPSLDDPFRIEEYGVEMDTPFGVAAGPHSQMAQNIIVSWLVGARFLELKTVQTLDELDINKPCIDCEDEGYNVEWSQELKVHESFDEYLRAWVLIYALHHKLGFPTPDPGMIFNMSVGYNLEGILEPNVQWYLDVMRDASDYLPSYVDIVAKRYPKIADVDIPSELSNTITLSTMHGCPPDEIERIMAPEGLCFMSFELFHRGADGWFMVPQMHMALAILARRFRFNFDLIDEADAVLRFRGRRGASLVHCFVLQRAAAQGVRTQN